jgi:hypothetical protein
MSGLAANTVTRGVSSDVSARGTSAEREAR